MMTWGPVTGGLQGRPAAGARGPERASSNRRSGVVVNLPNVVTVRVSQKDSAATGQYL
jgi:hypothetical protein